MKKFNLFDKVLIKSDRREGTVVGIFRHTPSMNGIYIYECDVSYLHPNYMNHDNFATEYLGLVRSTSRFSIDDLEITEEYMSYMRKWTNEAFNELFPNSASTLNLDEYAAKNPPTGTACEHIFKQYTGFTQNYEYCEKCDLKR